MSERQSENKKYSKPSDFMRQIRPDQFSDSSFEEKKALDPKLLEYVLDTITARKEETVFEFFSRKLCERVLCPNLIPQTGPTGGGDSKVDTETYPVAERITDTWYRGIPNRTNEDKWAFAFSAKKDWLTKVKKDVASICSTDRGYKLIYFVTNQFVKDKKRAEVEDAMTKECGIAVKILDRSWIVEKIVENGHADIAISSLGIEGGASATKVSLGPNDAKWGKEIECLEKQISDSARYAGVEFQLIEDCLESALLSRNLEKTKAEVEGKFQRAMKVATKYGTKRHQLRVLYSHLWSMFWWYDESQPLHSRFEELEALADSSNADDLECISNILTSLKGAVRNDALSEQEANVSARGKRLYRKFLDIEKDVARPSNALWAKSMRLSQDIFDSVGNSEKLDGIITDITEVLEIGECMLDFPIMRLCKLIQACEQVFDGNSKFDCLFDKIISTTKERTGDTEAGYLVLNRASEKLKQSKYYAALTMAGRAQSLFAKQESQRELIKSLGMCGFAYFELGLIWAARVSFMAAIDRALKIFWKEGGLSKTLLLFIRKMVWIEIRLGRVPSALAWIELSNILERQAESSLKNSKIWKDERNVQDGVLGMLILKTQFRDLKEIDFMPGLFERMGLFLSEASCLFALGDMDKLLATGIVPSGKEEDAIEFFAKLAGQPAKDQIKEFPSFQEGNLVNLESKILGCNLIFEAENSLTSIVLSESLLGVMEGLFASSITSNVYAHKSALKIKVQSDSTLKDFPTIDEQIVEGETEIVVRHPVAMLDECSSVEARMNLRRWLLDAAWKVFLTFVSLSDPDKFFKQILVDEGARERSLLFADLWVLLDNIFGDRKLFSLGAWKAEFGDKVESIPLRRTEAWNYSVEQRACEAEPLKQGEGEPPKELFDVELRRHGKISVESVINMSLWNKAKWGGVMFAMTPEYPPIFSLGFENNECGIEIFKGWRQKVGKRDEKDLLKITVVRGVDKYRPSDYVVLVGTNFDATEGDAFRLITFVNRVQRMRPKTSENLDRFLASYQKFGCYYLAPSLMGSLDSIAEAVNSSGILKRTIVVRDAWTIGEHDPDVSGLIPEDDPIIPVGVKNPPVQKALEKIRERREK